MDHCVQWGGHASGSLSSVHRFDITRSRRRISQIAQLYINLMIHVKNGEKKHNAQTQLIYRIFATWKLWKCIISVWCAAVIILYKFCRSWRATGRFSGCHLRCMRNGNKWNWRIGRKSKKNTNVSSGSMHSTIKREKEEKKNLYFPRRERLVLFCFRLEWSEIYRLCAFKIHYAVVPVHAPRSTSPKMNELNFRCRRDCFLSSMSITLWLSGFVWGRLTPEGGLLTVFFLISCEIYRMHAATFTMAIVAVSQTEAWGWDPTVDSSPSRTSQTQIIEPRDLRNWPTASTQSPLTKTRMRKTEVVIQYLRLLCIKAP